MTAIGLVVAVPAVMAYNWLMRRNKSVLEELARFTNDVHGYMMSGGSVRPATAASGGAARPTTGATSGVGATGGVSTAKAGTTSTGSATGATTASANKM